MNDLFRKEALKYQQKRLQGDVFLKLKPHWLALGSICGIIVLIVLLVACLSTFSDKITVGAKVASYGPPTLVTALWPALFESQYVSKGEKLGANKVIIALSTPGKDVPESDLPKQETCFETPQSATPRIFKWIVKNDHAYLISCQQIVVTDFLAPAGRNIRVGDGLVIIRSENEDAIIDIPIPNTKVEMAKVGQIVHVRIPSKFGEKPMMIPGEIESLLYIADEESKANSVYTARARLSKDLKYRGTMLNPGMHVEADVVFRRQTGFKWIFGRNFLKEKN